MSVRQVVTAEQLERTGRKDLELVRGELVPVTPAGFKHGALAGFLTIELGAYARAHACGRVLVETGFRLFTDPDTVRGPDVSYLSRERQETLPRRGGFVHGVPDLAIEVVSMEKTPEQLASKAREYITAGTPMVWVVDPEARQVTVYRGREVMVLKGGDSLDGGDVLPGFVLPVTRLFAEIE
jgi:Uma2 family endonuclease